MPTSPPPPLAHDVAGVEARDPQSAHGAVAPRTPGELARFGRTVGGALLASAAVALWRGRPTPAGVAVGAGAVLVLLASLAPRALAGVERRWMALALALSRVTTPIFMAVVYLGVLTPVALVLRLLGRAPLRPPAPGASAWVERPADARRSDLRRQF